MNEIPKIDMRTLSQIAQTNLARPQWQPMIVLGPPGCGKSYFGRDTLQRLYAAHLGVDKSEIGFVEIKPAERDGVEIAGVTLPFEDEDGTMYTKFTLSPVLRQIQESGLEHGVVNVDEVAAAGNPEQKVLSPLFDPKEHSIGGNKLPKGWIVYGTGNRAQDKAGSGRLLSHLINRVKLFDLQRDARQWAEDFAIPHGVNPLIIDCALAHQDFFAESVPVEHAPYCTERSLTMASADLDAFMASPEYTGQSIPRWMELMLASNIGQVAARRVVTWAAQSGQVPTGEEILRDPHGAQVPDQTGFQMIAANLAMSLVNDAMSARQVLHYLVRLRKDLQIPLGVKLMNQSATKGWVISDPLASAFIAEYHQFLPMAQDAVDSNK